MPRQLRAEPVIAERWQDLLGLFGPNGAYSNCWCTWWLLTGGDWERAAPEDRRSLLEALVADGEEPGLLAFEGNTAVGWCAVGPRSRYARFTSSRARVYGALDDAESWVVNCFYIPREQRGSGVATFLLDAAVEFVAQRGGTLVEGYPIDQSVSQPGAAALFTGTLVMFEAAGFEEVSRTNNRPLVRRWLD